MSKSSNSKQKISAEIPKEDYELIKLLADQNSQSVSEWIRQAIQKGIPEALRKKVVSVDPLDKVNAMLEAEEDLGPIPTLPLPPAAEALIDMSLRKPQADDPDPYGISARAEGKRMAEATADYVKREGTAPHACVYLVKGGSAHFRDVECEGTCTSPKQNGRVCFWPSQVARNCDAYRPRHVPR